MQTGYLLLNRNAPSIFLQITPKTTFSAVHASGEYYASSKMGKKIGQKLANFRSNFCPGSTTSCGQTLLFLLFSTILHHYHALNMCRMPELVNRPDLLQFIPSVTQHAQISRQRRRIAAYIDNTLRAHLKHRLKALLVTALPWRVNDDNVRAPVAASDCVPASWAAFSLLSQHF